MKSENKKISTAVVTGGASGMGRIFALRMAATGTHVAVLDCSEENLQSMQQTNNISIFHCDVSNQQQVESVLQKIKTQRGNIDRLVHCAAIMPTGKLTDMDTATINHLMSINYGGTVNVTKAVLKDMLAQNKGEVIVFGSSGGSVLVPECGAYCATKAATNAYMEILIEENRHSNIHFMLVCPPLVNTPLLDQATVTSSPKTVTYSIERKRFLEPESVIDDIEKGLSKGKRYIWPGAEVKILHWLRRFSPLLLWKVMHAANS